MRSPQRWFRPSLETLEGRDTPANLAVTFDAFTHTLSVTGDTDNNQLQIRAVSGDTTRFLLSSPSDTINLIAGDFQSPTGVKNITIKLFPGDDNTTFSNANGPVKVKQNLTIYGGVGANTVNSTDLSVGGSFGITNGTNTTGTDSTNLINLTVGGSLTINNGDGDTSTNITRSSAGISFIRGSVTITNGSGTDMNQIYDTNVGGSVTVTNGIPNAANVAGRTWLYNASNTTARCVVGGNVTVSYSGGNGSAYDGIWDAHVLGNVSFNHGSGAFTTNFDAYSTTLPVKIGGNLTLTGTGANVITVGTQYKRTGLLVGGALSVTSFQANDTLRFNRLTVGGATLLKLGKGNNTATIDDSEFGGTLTLNTNAGADIVNLDTTAGTSQATTFAKSVLINLGDGADSVVREGVADVNQRIVFYRSFVIHHGPGADTTSSNAAQEASPFGSLVQWLI